MFQPFHLKKKHIFFLLALGQIVANFWMSFLLKQAGVSAAQSTSCFIYLNLLALEQRSSQAVYREVPSQSKFILMRLEL